MTDEELALYQEQQEITQALRRFIQPHPADNPVTFTSEELEYADRLRQRYQGIQRQLDKL